MHLPEVSSFQVTRKQYPVAMVKRAASQAEPSRTQWHVGWAQVRQTDVAKETWYLDSRERLVSSVRCVVAKIGHVV